MVCSDTTPSLLMALKRDIVTFRKIFIVIIISLYGFDVVGVSL